MFIPLEKSGSGQCQWQEFVLVHPAVSVGGVGQLAVDLILHNLPDIEKIGFLYDQCFVPVVGLDPFETRGKSPLSVCTSCEVFQSKSRKLVVIQQRSPFIKGRIPSFRRKLLEWIKSCSFKRVVTLGSCSSHVQNDVDLKLPAQHVMYLASQHHESFEKSFTEKLNWKKFSHCRPSLDEEDPKKELFIPGGGILKMLYEDCCASNIAMVGLLVFSNEGNGTADAITLTDAFNVLLSLVSDVESFKPGGPWKIPFSWSKIVNSRALPKIY